MNMKLKQIRKGFKALIDEDRQTMSISSLTDPSDPFGGKTEKTFTGRISHESARQAPELNQSPAGFSTNLSRFLSVEYTVDFLKKGDIATDQNGRKWKLGPVDPLEKFKGVHGYQSPLEDANG